MASSESQKGTIHPLDFLSDASMVSRVIRATAPGKGAHWTNLVAFKTTE